MKNWTEQHSRELYNIPRWGENFFDVNAAGEVVAKNPQQPDHPGIALSEIVSALRSDGFDLPVLIRFNNILHYRIEQLCTSFELSMQKNKYQGRFTPVYPIKVNQQFSVVDTITHHPEHSVGLEAGSKTELLAILSLKNKPQGTLVCNGYKDKEFIRMALISEQLGYRTYIVLEKLSELSLLLQQAQELRVTPRLGIRIQLNSTGCGVWQNTGGEKSKFGLSASDVLSVIKTLKSSQQLELLQLLHFHLGSQIPDIKFIEKATSESAQYLVQLHHIGCQIKCIDVGGGLGVDYDGSNSNSDFSINYNLQSYAECIVSTYQKTCQQHSIPHPDIFTESGRAMTAHHAVLITNVVEYETSELDSAAAPVLLNCPELLQLDQLLASLSHKTNARFNDSFQQADNILKQIHSLFISGERDLPQRARAEQLYRRILEYIQQQFEHSSQSNNEFSDFINQKLAAKYFCNFSLFQSLPDIWALRQIFPIMPLQRLLEKPECHGVLRDITCDSDGRIDSYIENDRIEPSLRLHPVNKDENYLLGFFLVGAYQEILGDMHNLFGDTHSVNVTFTGTGYKIAHLQRGESVQYILNHIHFDPEMAVKNFEVKIKSAMLNTHQANQFIAELKSGLSGYSYLKSKSS